MSNSDQTVLNYNNYDAELWPGPHPLNNLNVSGLVQLKWGFRTRSEFIDYQQNSFNPVVAGIDLSGTSNT